MKSTGEVMGKDITLEKALYKGLVASGMTIKSHGSVLLTVADKDKEEALQIAQRFHNIGYPIDCNKQEQQLPLKKQIFRLQKL